jgi:hypothetical protein
MLFIDGHIGSFGYPDPHGEGLPGVIGVITFQSTAEPPCLNANDGIPQRFEIRTSPKHLGRDRVSLDLMGLPGQGHFHNKTEKVLEGGSILKLTARQDAVQVLPNGLLG